MTTLLTQDLLDQIVAETAKKKHIHFYEPENKTCLSGTANQFIGQNEAAKAMIKVLRHPIAPGK
jgi:hypothetical protein